MKLQAPLVACTGQILNAGLYPAQELATLQRVYEIAVCFDYDRLPHRNMPMSAADVFAYWSCIEASREPKMMQPKIYIASTTGITGSTSALLHLESENNVYGWYLESTKRQVLAGFFMLEDFYAQRHVVLYRSTADDVYGDWIRDHPPGDHLMRCPVPESVVHELERLQSKLVNDWLFFESEPGSAIEFAAYGQHGAMQRAVNIRSRKLNRLVRDKVGWHHWTPGFDQNVLDHLQKYARSDRCMLSRQ